MPLDWAPFVELVHRPQRFLLTTHIRPDADGLGSQLALAEVLRRLGKEVRLVIASSWPPRYNFLDPERRIERFAPPGDACRDAEAVVRPRPRTRHPLGEFPPLL